MLSLKATVRTQFGKKLKKLREEGLFPGVLYGRKTETIPISLDYKDFDSVYKEAGESALISIEVNDKENVVLIRDVVVHPLTDRLVHSDFYQVPMDEKITITIPVSFENEAPAVKNEGAVLIRNVYELDVSALPKNLPREITADLSALEHVDDSILVKDISLLEGVSIDAEDDLVIASVSAPQEEEIIEEEAPEEVAPGEIKTEAEEKREKEEEEAEEKPEEDKEQ